VKPTHKRALQNLSFDLSYSAVRVAGRLPPI
jgi:hypothetical protein